MNSKWNQVEYRFNGAPAGADALRQLREDEAAVIVLKNAIQLSEFQGLATEVHRRRDRATVSHYSNGELTTFGTYLAKHLEDPAKYFEAADSGDDLFVGQSVDLREVVRQRLCQFLSLSELEVAREPDGRVYAPAIIRIHADGVSNPLHNDNIMRDAMGSGLMLSHLRHQFSCVTCLQECDAHGELVHYRRRWEPNHEKYKVPAGLGYKSDAVAGAEFCRFRPQSGDVYLIDPTHFHSIDAVRGRARITMGFFFGFFDDGFRNGVCWS